MKLLLIAENWPPRVGGIETYLTNLVAHLDQHSVMVVAPPAPASTSAFKIASNTTVIRNRFFWPIIKPGWLPLLWYVHRLVRRENVDVVLCGKALFEGLIGYALKKMMGIPYIVFTYAMEIETWAGSPRTKKKLLRVLQFADRVIYINETTKSRLQELGVKDLKLAQIYPGVPEKFFHAQRHEDVIKKYGVDRPYILTIARLIERKGIDDLISGFASLDPAVRNTVQLVVGGEGPARGYLEELTRKLLGGEGQGTVVFTGYIPETDLPYLYAGAKLFALTPKQVGSDLEGFGIVYLEAAAAGIPSLATKTGGAVEAVVHNQTGIVVEPDNPKAIREALARLLSDQNLLKTLGRQAKDRADREFRWTHQAKKLDDTLMDIFSKESHM